MRLCVDMPASGEEAGEEEEGEEEGKNKTNPYVSSSVHGLAGEAAVTGT